MLVVTCFGLVTSYCCNLVQNFAPHVISPFGYFMQVLTCILKNDRQYWSKGKQGHNRISLYV